MPQVPAGGLTAGGGPLATLTPESEQNLEALRRAIRRSACFGIHVILVAPEARRELIRRLHLWSGDGGLPSLRFLDEGDEAERSVMALLEGSALDETIPGLVLPDVDVLFDTGRALEALNMARDRLASLVGGPLLLVVGDEQAAELGRRAPDLFDVRATTTEVTAERWALDLHQPWAMSPRSDRIPAVAETRERAARLRAIEQQAPDTPRGFLVDGWLRLADDFRLARELGEAEEAARAALRLAASMEPPYLSGEAWALLLLGAVAGEREQTLGQREFLERAAALFRRANDRTGLANALHQLGRVAIRTGDLRRAKTLLRESLDLFKSAGPSENLAGVHFDLGRLFVATGRRRDAERHLQEALARSRRDGNPIHIGNTLGSLGELLLQRERTVEAEARFREALEQHTAAGDVVGQAIDLANIARVKAAAGQPSEAESSYLRAIELARRGNALPTLALALSALAGLLESQGRADEAARYRDEARPIEERLTAPRGD